MSHYTERKAALVKDILNAINNHECTERGPITNIPCGSWKYGDIETSCELLSIVSPVVKHHYEQDNLIKFEITVGSKRPTKQHMVVECRVQWEDWDDGKPFDVFTVFVGKNCSSVTP